VSRPLVCTTVRRGVVRRQIVHDRVQLADDVVKNLLPRCLWWRGDERPSHERDASEEIQAVPVAQRAQEPGFGAVLRDLRTEGRIILAPLREFRVLSLPQELVRERDLE